MSDLESPKPSSAENPYEAVGLKTWQKGMKLGVAVLVLFIGGAVLAFLVLTLLEVQLASRILMAAILGPFIGTGGFIVWWLVKPPISSPQ